MTPRTRAILQELIFSKPVWKLPAFYGTRNFVTVFTTARHFSLSWARSIQFSPHSFSWRLILILLSHLLLGPPSCSFPHVSPPKPCTNLSSHRTWDIALPSCHYSRFYHPNNNLWEGKFVFRYQKVYSTKIANTILLRLISVTHKNCKEVR